MDDILLRSIGAIPCLNKERIALEGIFNFPKRKGTSEYDWGTSIEPFVEEHEMIFEGRTLTLNAWLRGNNPSNYVEVVEAFKLACIDCRVLSTGYADFDVLLKDQVKIVEYIGHCRARAAASFWQETAEFPEMTTVPSGGEGYRLDGFNLRNDFGIMVYERKDNNNVGKRIEVETTLPYSHTRFRDKGTITLKCYMRGNGFAELYAKMSQFHSLCASPGLRELCFPDGKVYSGYLKDGFTAKAVHATKIDFDFKLRVI